MLQPVQRTLMITLGPIAQQAGQKLRARFDQHPGPEWAVAAVNLAPANGQTVQAAVTDIQTALTQISAPTLMTRLSEHGYTLADVPEIALFLLVDSASPGADQVVEWVKEVVTIIQNYLGLDAAALLIWLVNDPAGPETTTCLLTSEAQADLFGRGILTLSLLNEVGLRLPDETALATACADILWLFVATPLGAALDLLTDYEGQNRFSSVGITHWQWDREQVTTVLHQRWMLDVLQQWNKPITQSLPPATLDHWLTDVGLSQQHLQTHIQTACVIEEPVYDEALWQAPRPWDIRHLFMTLATTEAHDQEQQAERQKKADLRLEEILQMAAQTVKQQIHWLLDEKPVGGIAYADCWLMGLKEAFNRMAAWFQPETQAENQNDWLLPTVRQELETRQQELLLSWPTEGALAWVSCLIRPWRWPRLLWDYWQLRSIGQQLTLIYRHQAQQRRQAAALLTTRHAYMALDQIVRHCLCQVEEIGDMLGCLQSEIGDWRQTMEGDRSLVVLVTILYPLLFKEPKVEAERAAEALGGMGQQFLKLDDEPVMQALQRCGRERLAPITNYTAAQLLSLLHPAPENLGQWWQGFWQQATPLWRYDPTRLPERVRAQGTTLACLCGQGANRFLKPEMLSPEMRCLETGDPEHLFLLRLRGGLTASTLIFHRGNDDENLLSPRS